MKQTVSFAESIAPNAASGQLSSVFNDATNEAPSGRQSQAEGSDRAATANERSTGIDSGGSSDTTSKHTDASVGIGASQEDLWDQCAEAYLGNEAQDGRAETAHESVDDRSQAGQVDGKTSSTSFAQQIDPIERSTSNLSDSFNAAAAGTLTTDESATRMTSGDQSITGSGITRQQGATSEFADYSSNKDATQDELLNELAEKYVEKDVVTGYQETNESVRNFDNDLSL